MLKSLVTNIVDGKILRTHDGYYVDGEFQSRACSCCLRKRTVGRTFMGYPVCIGCINSLREKDGMRICVVCKNLHVDLASYDDILYWTSERYYRVTNSRAPVCLSCFRTQFATCQACSVWFQVKGPRTMLCPPCDANHQTCIRCTRPTSKELFNHMCRACFRYYGEIPYDRTPKFKHFGKGLLLGVEVEVIPAFIDEEEGFVEEVKRHAKDLDQDFFGIKHDGSMRRETGELGFEIVSAPATIDEHRERWDWLFKRKGLKVNDFCGIHVHIDRKMLGKLNVVKLGKFVYLPDNFAFLQMVAERLCDRYANFSVRDDMTGEEVVSGRKYEALRLNQAQTVELRIFQASLQPEKFWKNIEFTLALAQFTQAISMQNATDRFQFIEWVEKNRKDFKHLFNFLQEKGYY